MRTKPLRAIIPWTTRIITIIALALLLAPSTSEAGRRRRTKPAPEPAAVVERPDASIGKAKGRKSAASGPNANTSSGSPGLVARIKGIFRRKPAAPGPEPVQPGAEAQTRQLARASDAARRSRDLSRKDLAENREQVRVYTKIDGGYVPVPKDSPVLWPKNSRSRSKKGSHAELRVFNYGRFKVLENSELYEHLKMGGKPPWMDRRISPSPSMGAAQGVDAQPASQSGGQSKERNYQAFDAQPASQSGAQPKERIYQGYDGQPASQSGAQPKERIYQGVDAQPASQSGAQPKERIYQGYDGQPASQSGAQPKERIYQGYDPQSIQTTNSHVRTNDQ